MKTKPASALITLPASLILSMGNERESIVRRLSWGVDACVELKGFAGRYRVQLINILSNYEHR